MALFCPGVPHDSNPCQRLDMQQRLWYFVMDDLYGDDAREAVEKALKARESIGERPAILDVGSGSGVW